MIYEFIALLIFVILFPKFQKKFMLPSNALVDSKVLSSIGDRLRGYKRSLRVKYIKKDTTKEQLYALPLPESAKENEITRPKGVGDPMWFGFVDLCFSDKFKVSYY